MLRLWRDKWTKCHLVGSLVRHQYIQHADHHCVCKSGYSMYRSLPANTWCDTSGHTVNLTHTHRYTQSTGALSSLWGLSASGQNTLNKYGKFSVRTNVSEIGISIKQVRDSHRDSYNVISEESTNGQHISSNTDTKHDAPSELNTHQYGEGLASGDIMEGTGGSGTIKNKQQSRGNKSSFGQLNPSSQQDSVAPITVSGEIDVSNLRPVVPPRAYNLAAYVNESKTLSNFVKLGVNLAEVQKDKEIASFLTRLDFEQDVQPYLLFLLNAGVKSADLGGVITKNPALFRERMEDLEVKVNYLQSKKFSTEAIGRIFSKAPALLSMATVDIDKRLGFLQKEFHLKGNEVRAVVTSHPAITVCNAHWITENSLAFGDFMGFTDYEKKQILLAAPKLYRRRTDHRLAQFDYLHNTMELSHQAILAWPDIFRTRLHIIRQRHQFLKAMGRDQFDPTKENFVSLKALVTGTDEIFSTKIAKADVALFNDFLKTI